MGRMGPSGKKLAIFTLFTFKHTNELVDCCYRNEDTEDTFLLWQVTSFSIE